MGLLAWAGPSTPPPSTIAPLVNQDPCPFAAGPHDYVGSVGVEGAAPLPLVTLSYSYDTVVLTQILSGPIDASVCATETDIVHSNASGSFGFTVYPHTVRQCSTLPNGQVRCTYTSGPYGPVTVTADSPNPLGYLPSITENATNFRLSYYPELSTVDLAPVGPSLTFSTRAVDSVSAEPLTGIGTPSPAHPQYDWSLSGVGWTFAGTPSGFEVNLTAAAGAAVGNLTVIATLPAAGSPLVTPATSVEVLAVPTTISSASLNRTGLDLGQSLEVFANGSGAEGYNYSATVDPGLGEPSTAMKCRSTPSSGDTVLLGCAATMSYSVAGMAQPVVTVSNGASTAVWQFPDVTIDPLPSVLFLPGAPVGYTAAPVTVEVEAGAGSGTAPYAEACLASGVGATQCSTSPGPVWTFDPTYATPGNYSARAWTVDSTGANRSAETTVRVVPPLSVEVPTIVGVGSAGVPIALEAVISGGDLPARLWWNVTGASNPVASEVVTVDGPVTATFVPSAAGFVTVSVVVIDGLDTAVRSSETWTVGRGLAASLAPVVLPSASAARAGAPLTVTWEALDSVGEEVRTFDSAAEIELGIGGSDATASGWVNASGVGPLASRLAGWFDVPAAAWIDGTLNVSVTSEVAGPIHIVLTVAAGLPGGTDTVGVVVLPDVDHLRLSDPHVLVGDPRENSTLWQVADRFGNPAVGASLVVTTSSGGTTATSYAPVFSESDGGTGVWVNFSVAGVAPGTVTVTDLSGRALHSPIAVPGLPGPFSWVVPLLPLLAALGIGGSMGTVAMHRARRPRPVAAEAPNDPEGDLHRLAVGRAAVVDAVQRAGPVDLAGLASGWEPPPGPADLADWVASLVTDGTLGATVGDDGVARFCIAPVEDRAARVTVDVDAFDRAQMRRTAATTEPDRDDA